MSEDMSPYCSANDEWLIMKLCMYVGYHDANNVSNFGGDQVTQLNLVLYSTIKWSYQPKHSPSKRNAPRAKTNVTMSHIFLPWNGALMSAMT